MKKRIKIVLSVTVILLVISAAGISCFIGSQVFLASTQLVTNEKTKGVSDTFWERFGMNYEDFSTEYEIEQLEITSSFDGHIIPADYIYAKESRNAKNYQTVILIHGLGGNRYSNYPLAEFFLDKGYNVITYDQRSSNENTAQYTTFGYWEKYDLADWIDFAKKQAPEQTIGIWGTSFGGATAGLALGHENIDDKVDFMILDCPVSSMKWMIEQEIRNMNVGIPISYMVWCGNIANKLKLGFTYEDACVGEAMKDVNTPVLIINSKKDSLTPYFMGKDIYDSIQVNSKRIWTVEDSEHADIWLDYNNEYKDVIENFMMENQTD